jgi:hypothetical protein
MSPMVWFLSAVAMVVVLRRSAVSRVFRKMVVAPMAIVTATVIAHAMRARALSVLGIGDPFVSLRAAVDPRRPDRHRAGRPQAPSSTGGYDASILFVTREYYRKLNYTSIAKNLTLGWIGNTTNHDAQNIDSSFKDLVASHGGDPFACAAVHVSVASAGDTR